MSAAASASASALAAAFTEAVILSNEQCNVNELLKFSEPLTSGGWDYHRLITVVSAITCILCCALSGFLMLGHLLNWTNSAEQRQLVRVIFTLPAFAICSFFSVWFYAAAGYLTPIPQVVDCFGIVALFYFYVTCVTPHESIREQFYENLERQRSGAIMKRIKGVHKYENGSLRWFHVIWILVFQLLLGRIATTICYEYFEDTLCPLSQFLLRRTFIISLITGVQTSIAVMAVINYEQRMKAHLKAGGHRAFSKLLSFKALIFIQLIQEIIFKGLSSYFVLKPTKHVSYLDITVGTPALLLCLEVFLFSIVFLWTFTFAPYRKVAKERPGDKRSFFSGLIDVVNIMDMIKGIGFMFKIGEYGTRHSHQNETEAKALGLTDSTSETLPVPQEEISKKV